MRNNPYLIDINLKETEPIFVSLRSFALEHNIPIMAYETRQFIKQVILLRNIKSVLEIGTAMGYGSLAIAHVDGALRLTTIERDETMISLAQEHFQAYDKDKQITLVKGDALTIDLKDLNGPYDLIFIDAAKAQSNRFFLRFESLLTPEGVIITDNLLFHDMIGKRQSSRNLNQLLRKIDTFNRELMKKENYHTVIYPIGDGIGLSIKKR